MEKLNAPDYLLEEAKEVINELLIGPSGRLKSTVLTQPYFTESKFCSWVKAKTQDVETTLAGRLHLILAGLPVCPVCTVRTRAYYNGVLATCGKKECVSQSKSKTAKSVKRPRSEKQKQFVIRNLDNFLNKGRATIEKRYGVSNAYQIDKVKQNAKINHKLWIEQSRKTRTAQNLERLGLKFDVSVNSVTKEKSSWLNYTCECGFSEEKTRYTLEHRKKIAGGVCSRCLDISRGSLEQTALFNFVRSFVPAEQNNRRVLAPYEVDIWVPSLNLAIEYNGIFWHSSKTVKDSNRQYHQDKALYARKLGITLIQIWSHWDKEKVKNFLLPKLQQVRRIPARATSFSALQPKVVGEAMKKWHIDGSAPSKFAFGLIHNNEVVAAVLISKGRFSPQHEIIRYASLPGVVVVGGLGKLISNAMRHLEINELVSFCKLEFDGSGYAKAGGRLVAITKPAENWIHLKTGRIISRLSSQKHRLPRIIDCFDHRLTAHQNLENAGWRVFWTAGNQKFIFDRKAVDTLNKVDDLNSK